MKKLIALLCLLACVPAAHAARETQQPDAWILRDIVHYRTTTWDYQQLMGVRRTPYTDHPESDPSTVYKLWVRELWRARAVRALRHFRSGPAHRRQWLCIHRFERHPRQRWRTNTGNGYYGGLQMDIAFMRTYGPRLLRKKGTADRWTPLEQMWVAERAYRSGRGFHPWPNTARYCGLL